MSRIRRLEFQKFEKESISKNKSLNMEDVYEIEVPIEFSLGKIKRQLGELNNLKSGTTIVTDIDLNNKVDLLVSGVKKAKAEVLVTSEGKLAVKII